MASTYRKQLQEKQHEELQKLVLHLLPVQEGEENYASALDFCASNLNPLYHTYLDVDAKAVDVVYASLGDRMEQHQQMAKAGRLRQAVAALQGLNLQGENPDMCASLLSMLFKLAQRPLTSPMPPDPLLSAQKPAPPPVHHPRHDSGTDEPERHVTDEDAKSMSEVASDWSEDSELSDWGLSSPVGADSPSLPPQRTPGRTAEVFGAWSGQQLGASSATISKQTLAPPPPPPATDPPLSLCVCPEVVPRRALPQPGDLVPCVLRLRWGEESLTGSWSETCVTDQHLAHQVCNVLLGGTSSCFTWQPAAPARTHNPTPLLPTLLTQLQGHYVPVPGLHTPHVTAGALCSLLSSYATTASQLAWLQALVQLCGSGFLSTGTTQRPSGDAWQAGVSGAAGVLLTPTTRALLQALAAQLQELQQQLIRVQQTTQFAHVSSSQCTIGSPSLLQLRALLLGYQNQVHHLYTTVSAAMQAYCHVAQQALAAAAADVARSERTGEAGGRSTVQAVDSSRGGSRFLGSLTSQAQAAVAAAGAAARLGEVPGRSTAAVLGSSALLDVLYDTLDSVCGGEGPVELAHQQRLLHLLCCALQPLLSSLHAWLFEGVDDGIAEDFFISCAPGLGDAEASPTTRYRFVMRPAAGATDGKDQEPACPKLLQPCAQQLLSAGKALRLLRSGSTATGTPTTHATAALLAAIPGLLMLQPPLPTQPPILTMLSSTPSRSQSTLSTDSSTALINHFLSQVSTQVNDYSSHDQPPQRSETVLTAWTGRQDSCSPPWAALMQMAGQEVSRGAVWPPGAGGVSNSQEAVGADDTIPCRPTPQATLSPCAAAAEQHVEACEAASDSTQQSDQHRDTPLHGSVAPEHRGVGDASAGEGATQSLEQWAVDMEGAMSGSRDAPCLGWKAVSPHRRSKAAASPLRPPPGHMSKVPSLTNPSDPQRQLAWLLDPAHRHQRLPLVRFIIKQCLLDDLKQQAQLVEQQLLGCLISSWGLLTELRATRNLFLLAAPAAQSWAHHFLLGILRGKELVHTSEGDIQMSLVEAASDDGAGGGVAIAVGGVAGGPDGALPAMDCVSVGLNKNKVLEARNKSMQPGDGKVLPLGGLVSVTELEGLTVQYQPSWLMSVLGGPETLLPYSKVLVLLLQVTTARMALEFTRTSAWRFLRAQARLAGRLTTHSREEAVRKSNQALGPRQVGLSEWILEERLQNSWDKLTPAPAIAPAGSLAARQQKQRPIKNADVRLKRADELVLQEMFQFVTNLHQYVVDRLLWGAWAELEQGLDKATSLDELVQHHKTFLAALEHHSGQGTSDTWKSLWVQIRWILDQVLRYCAGQQLLMDELKKVTEDAAQITFGPSLTQPGRTVTVDQEAARQARHQMAAASHAFRDKLRFMQKFVAMNATAHSDKDISTLLTRINFNGFYDQASRY